MSEILILQCSPHAGGVSDRLARYFADGLSTGSCPVRILALRDIPFHACDGCNACKKAPYECSYAAKDDLSELYAALQNSRLAVFSSPIYFYALPSLCLAFIDRAQSLWNKSQNIANSKTFPPGIALFAAARAKGQKLFTGASLCLSCFLKSGGGTLLAKYAFRDLEHIDALAARPHIQSLLFAKGREWARYVSLNSRP